MQEAMILDLFWHDVIMCVFMNRRCMAYALSLGRPHRVGFGDGVVGGERCWEIAVHRASSGGSSSLLG